MSTCGRHTCRTRTYLKILVVLVLSLLVIIALDGDGIGPLGLVGALVGLTQLGGVNLDAGGGLLLLELLQRHRLGSFGLSGGLGGGPGCGGLGGALFDAVMTWMAAQSPPDVWIGVWSENFGAQRFYARRGFQKVGEYGFPVGNTIDREFILRRRPAF